MTSAESPVPGPERRGTAAEAAARLATAFTPAITLPPGISEAELIAALDVLSEAVTIQDATGRVIYANQQAAEMMGLATPADVLAQPGSALVDPYSYFDEDGRPLHPDAFPGRRLLRGEEPTSLVMRVVERDSGRHAWRLVRATAVLDDDGAPRLVVNVVADITAERRADLGTWLLVRAGEVLIASLELGEILQRVARLCIPVLADWASVRLLDPTGRRLESVAVAHADPEKLAAAHRTRQLYSVEVDGPGQIATAFRTGEPVCTNHVDDAMLLEAATDSTHLAVMRRLDPFATLCLPLCGTEGPVGVLTLVSAESRQIFDDRDIELGLEVARRAALAVENARLYARRSRVAATLAASLRPAPLPEIPGWELSSLYRPAGEDHAVGGDFFDVIPLPDGRWTAVIGDVTGRGAGAASLTAMMRHTLRSIASFTGSAHQALEKLNRDLLDRGELSLCTAACVTFSAAEPAAAVEIVCAGHPIPVRLRAGRAEPVGRPGSILGAYPDLDLHGVRAELEPGDVLVLYSDGVTDTVGAPGRFDVDRLMACLTGVSGARAAVSAIHAALGEFEVGPQADDVAVLALERR